MDHNLPPSTAEQGSLADADTWRPGPKLRGFKRLARAARHSLDGLVAGWDEPAFRLEAILAAPLLLAAFWIGRDWVEVSLLAGSVLAVLVVELLNTGLESVVDRVGPQWHALSKRAKDLGSAAVLLSLVACLGIWLLAVWSRLS